MHQTTQHYPLLDALRGVVAIAVLIFHLFEAVAFAAGSAEQMMFHGFLGVDFFLILSGFVMGYAYDSRWSSMTFGAFARRRLIRLHPMVVLGVVFGLVVFIAQGAMRWDGATMPWHAIAAATALALLLLPAPAAFDLRGNTEMFPLNGPHWSLFYEYLFNVIYALMLRRLSTQWLRLWVVIDGVLLFAFTISGTDGHIGCGWSVEPSNMLGGLLRVGFDYPMGLLLVRRFRKKQHSTLDARWVLPFCTAVLIALFAVPSLHGYNALYELLCVAAAFPLVIWTAARCDGGRVRPFATFLGNISYPLYAIHYPLIYLYIGWINGGITPFGPYAWCTPVALFVIAIAAAWLVSQCYDRPVRRWLSQRFNKE